VEVTEAATTFCLKRRKQNALSNVTNSSSHRQAYTPMIHIQSTHRTAPNFRKQVSLSVSFGRNGKAHTVCTQSDMCLYTCTYSSQYTDVGRAKEILNWDSSEMPRAKEIFPRVIFGTCAIGSSALVERKVFRLSVDRY